MARPCLPVWKAWSQLPSGSAAHPLGLESLQPACFDEQRMSLTLPYKGSERQMHVSDCSFQRHPKYIGSSCDMFTCGSWSGCEVRGGSATSAGLGGCAWLCCRNSLSVALTPADDGGAPGTASCCCDSCCCCSDGRAGTCVTAGGCQDGCCACEDVYCCRAGCCCDGPGCAERTIGMPGCTCSSAATTSGASLRCAMGWLAAECGAAPCRTCPSPALSWRCTGTSAGGSE